MSRFDRFGKLEHSRTTPAEPERAKPSLGRFESDAPPARAVEPAPPPEPAATVPEPDAPPPLGRFAADGGEHTRLEEDPLAKLGFRRCPACHADSGKWDTHCLYCRTSLTSPEAIAVNLALLENQTQQRAEEASRKREANVKEILDVADELLRKEREAENGYNLKDARGIRNLVMAVLGVVFTVLGLVVRTFPWTFIFLGIGLVLLAIRFPGLFTWRARRRFWW